MYDSASQQEHPRFDSQVDRVLVFSPRLRGFSPGVSEEKLWCSDLNQSLKPPLGARVSESRVYLPAFTPATLLMDGPVFRIYNSCYRLSTGNYLLHFRALWLC